MPYTLVMRHQAQPDAVNKKILQKLLKQKNQGVKIDIGCGANKIPSFVGVDIRPLPGVDIVADLEKYPWPIPSEVASLVSCSHVLEHINPTKVDSRLIGLAKLLVDKKVLSQKDINKYCGEFDFESSFIRFMDEVWRILKPGGEFMFMVPYAGTIGYYQDPTHINNITEATIYYFDPFHPANLYKIYRPKPWEIKHIFWDTEAIMEVLLIKRREDASFTQHVSLTEKGLKS